MKSQINFRYTKVVAVVTLGCDFCLYENDFFYSYVRSDFVSAVEVKFAVCNSHKTPISEHNISAQTDYDVTSHLVFMMLVKSVTMYRHTAQKGFSYSALTRSQETLGLAEADIQSYRTSQHCDSSFINYKAEQPLAYVKLTSL